MNLQDKFPNFNSFTPKRRNALIDMEFNLGPTQFRRQNWGGMFEAIDQGDWDEAARESYRKGVSEGRNQKIYQMLLGKQGK